MFSTVLWCNCGKSISSEFYVHNNNIWFSFFSFPSTKVFQVGSTFWCRINKLFSVNMPKGTFSNINHLSTILSRICIKSMTRYYCWLLINLISMKKLSTRDFINESAACSFKYFFVATVEYDCTFCYIFILILSTIIFINT